MTDALIILATSFWYGAIHAATPGHGKTIAAAYIVGARGRPVDAWILGIFITLSHTSGIVLVALLAAMGMPGLTSDRLQAYLAMVAALLVIVMGLWMFWTQRSLWMRPAPGGHSHDGHYHVHEPTGPGHVHAYAAQHSQGHAHSHAHGHDQAPGHSHAPTTPHAHDHEAGSHPHGPQPDHAHGEEGWHSHGWGMKHTHDISLVTDRRPTFWILVGLGIAGGLLPDPAALGILMNQMAQGKTMLGMWAVLAYSLGFAGMLVLVGVIAARVGPKVLDWLAGPWAMRAQVATSWLIVLIGVWLAYDAWRLVAPHLR